MLGIVSHPPGRALCQPAPSPMLWHALLAMSPCHLVVLTPAQSMCLKQWRKNRRNSHSHTRTPAQQLQPVFTSQGFHAEQRWAREKKLSDGVERCSTTTGQCDASFPVQKLLVSTRPKPARGPCSLSLSPVCTSLKGQTEKQKQQGATLQTQGPVQPLLGQRL